MASCCPRDASEPAEKHYAEASQRFRLRPAQVIVLRRTADPLGLNEAEVPKMPHEVGISPIRRGEVQKRRENRRKSPEPRRSDRGERDDHQLDSKRCLHGVPKHPSRAKVAAQRSRSATRRQWLPI